MKGRPAVFLDRDGTVIEDLHYPREPEKVKFVTNAIPGLKLLQEKGYLLFVVSNQSGVGRGIITMAEYEAVHARCQTLLLDEGVRISDYFYCLHRPEVECNCRKPQTGMIPKTFKDSSLDWSASVVVGDRESDLFLADAMGAKGYLVLSGKGRATRDALEQVGKLARYGVKTDLLEVATDLPFYG